MFVAVHEMRRLLGRFVLLTGAIALLVILLLFFQSVASALITGLTGGVEANSATVFVYSDKARHNPAASFLTPEAVDAVAAVDGVGTASGVARGQFTDEAADADVTVIGLQDLAFGGPAEIAAGRQPTGSGEALASNPTLSAGDASYEVGDTVTIEGTELQIVGTAVDAAFDVSPTLYVTFDDLQAMKTEDAGTAVPALLSWVAVAAADGVDPTELADRITVEASYAPAATPGGDTSVAAAGLEALDRSTAAADLPGAGQISQSFNILYLLLFVVVTIVTGVFFLILTVQKQDSLVLFRALGASRMDAVRPVLIEVVAVVGVGSVLGALMAAGLLYLARDAFGSTLSPVTTVVSVLFILVLGVVASLGAVRRVLAIDPVEAARQAGA
ncbi:MAG: FtsX-like permease family protein [Acidimicrobiales bacterium]